ncbi:MAG: DUF2905 domain-containing protein [Thermodesulfobacteriota bacterium]
MRQNLILLGVLLLAMGLAWPWLIKLPIGRLPGDIVIDRPGFRMYIPITTMLVMSAVLSLIAWLFRK